MKLKWTWLIEGELQPEIGDLLKNIEEVCVEKRPENKTAVQLRTEIDDVQETPLAILADHEAQVRQVSKLIDRNGKSLRTIAYFWISDTEYVDSLHLESSWSELFKDVAAEISVEFGV